MFSFFLLTVDIINKRGTAVGTLLLTLTSFFSSVVDFLIFYLFLSTSVSNSPVGASLTFRTFFCIQLWLTRDKKMVAGPSDRRLSQSLTIHDAWHGKWFGNVGDATLTHLYVITKQLSFSFGSPRLLSFTF